MQHIQYEGLATERVYDVAYLKPRNINCRQLVILFIMSIIRYLVDALKKLTKDIYFPTICSVGIVPGSYCGCAA